jgi:hypothetical protein
MTREPDYLNIHAGDEVVIGPLKGVRFWTYQFLSCAITSFQYHDIKWSPRQVAQSESIPTMKNRCGLNVYNTVDEAMRGSADAINDVIRGPDWWVKRRSGIVLGKVKFWGPAVEHEFGYRAQFVKPTKFLRAWGYQPELIVEKLNVLWFGEE